MVIIDESVYISENEKVESVISDHMWNQRSYHMYIMILLGYYMEENNSFQWWPATKDSSLIFISLMILKKLFFEISFWLSIISEFLLEIKDKGNEKKSDKEQ